ADESRARGFEPIDYQIAAGCLPLHLRRVRAEFPQHTGYLRADPAAVDGWRRRLAQVGPGLRVGVSWRGGTLRSRGPLRTLELARLEGLFRVAPATFVSLQHGTDGSEVGELQTRFGVRVLHFQEAIDDFDQTAALVSSLDLVISVCNTV